MTSRPVLTPPALGRVGGILLHPTSLPAPHGIGDLGPAAYRWIDWLAQAGCALWQVLPLGPTGYGDSPYQCLSTFAGNPLLISLENLVDEGLLAPADLAPLLDLPSAAVDFGAVIPARRQQLSLAYRRFREGKAPGLASELAKFTADEADWLDDFALFMALKDAHGGREWAAWDAPLARREPGELAKARLALAAQIDEQRFQQFLFFRQWQALRAYAGGREIRIFGDVPFSVALDSADVWGRPDLFQLDRNGRPTVVAGVPPDRFSPTGQLWGNPLYRWDVLRDQGYDWWIRRLRAAVRLVDLVRLDHFRGFAAFWEVPGDSTTAERGRWVPGPGLEFFRIVSQALGGLPIVAEDLGKITPDVLALRDATGLAGMKILQYAFEGRGDHEFLPHYYIHNCVAYTGTHDNDTARGWYLEADERTRDFCRRYLACDGEAIAWDMIRAIWSSVADWAIAPLQDTLDLDNDSRMNYPSRAEGNWAWRVRQQQLTPDLAARLHELSSLYGRTIERPPYVAGTA